MLRIFVKLVNLDHLITENRSQCSVDKENDMFYKKNRLAINFCNVGKLQGNKESRFDTMSQFTIGQDLENSGGVFRVAKKGFGDGQS